MISVNLPENSQDSSTSALELLKPDPPLEQKAEAKIQGNLLKGIDNCSGATCWDNKFLLSIFLYLNLIKKNSFYKTYWPLMVLNQERNFGRKLQFQTVLFPYKECVT